MKYHFAYELEWLQPKGIGTFYYQINVSFIPTAFDAIRLEIWLDCTFVIVINCG